MRLPVRLSPRRSPTRTGPHNAGAKKGQQFTRNERAINALRRSLANGTISTSDYAGIADAA